MEDIQQSKKSGFTQMSLKALKAISTSGGGYNEMAAYIVLCSGVNSKQRNRLCTHGAKSIALRTGISYRTAEKAIDWLTKEGFVREPTQDEPQFLSKTKSRSTTVRHVINDEQFLDVAVSNQFVSQTGGHDSPLKRIISQVDNEGNISRSVAVMDCIILFAALMKEQDFADCAGVDPDIWHQRFEPAEESDADFDQMTDVPNSNGVLVAVQGVDEYTTTNGFIFDVFGEPSLDDAHRELIRKRFWYALKELKRLRLVYRVLVLWSGNPLEPKQRKKAEPIATHYINDAWARTIDPHLQTEVHKTAWRTGARDTAMDFNGDQTGPAFAHTGKYRYIVNKNSVDTIFLVGQLRVRWWANNESNVQGRNIEHRRTNAKKDELARLRSGW
jgi:hypothetical protein